LSKISLIDRDPTNTIAVWKVDIEASVRDHLFGIAVLCVAAKNGDTEKKCDAEKPQFCEYLQPSKESSGANCLCC
jgi:hypothetical protein